MILFYVLLLSFTKWQSQIIKSQKYFNIVLRFFNLGSDMKEKKKNCRAPFFIWFLGFCNSLLMGQGQDQQHYPAVPIGGVSRARVRGYGCWC